MHTIRNAPGVWIPGFEPLERHHWKAPDEEKAAWLASALSDRPQAEPDRLSWLQDLNRSPQVDREPPDEYNLVGLKLTLDAVRNWNSLSEVFLAAGTKLIFLRRRNRLKHALSLYRHHEEDKSQFKFEGQLPASKLDLKRYDKWLRKSDDLHTESLEEQAAWEASAGDSRALALDYEDFVDDEGKKRTIKAVCGFIGADCSGMSFSSYYRKATADSLADSITNYREFADRYITTGFGRFLYD